MTSPLVGADDLAETISSGREAVTLLDVRYQMAAPDGPTLHRRFLDGHIPGARYVDLDDDLADPAGPGGRHPLPAPERFQDTVRRLGVSNDRPVVIYDDWQGRAAARAWWLLRFHGHQDVRVLDGGLSAWRDRGGDLEVGRGQDSVGDFTACGALDGMPMVDADEVLDVPVVIDAREPVRFRGEHEPVDPVAGHIPGAVNVPTSSNLDDTGRFAPVDVLKALYASVGAEPGVRVAVYCGSGVTAAHDVLSMETVGLRAALYPGSWSNWITDPQRPVATGP